MRKRSDHRSYRLIFGFNESDAVKRYIVASKDPVAIDQASADLVNQQIGATASCLKEGLKPGEDKFRAVYPKVDWAIQLNHGENIGLGSRKYELITI